MTSHPISSFGGAQDSEFEGQGFRLHREKHTVSIIVLSLVRLSLTAYTYEEVKRLVLIN